MNTEEMVEFEIELKSPGLFTRRIGVGNAYVSNDYIAGSTVLGALARLVILRNVEAALGNCANLKSSNQRPKCSSCSCSDRCMYLDLWVRHKLKIRDALPIPNKNGETIKSFVPNLLTIHRAKLGEFLADGLLLNSARRICVQEGTCMYLLAGTPWAESGDSQTNGSETKKKPKSVYVDNSTIQGWTLNPVLVTHVGIERKYAAARSGLLYTYSAHPSGSRFHVRMIGPSDIVNILSGEHHLSIGAGRSRGYGMAILRSLHRESLDHYVRRRAKAILNGFKQIERFFEEWGIEQTIGTVTGITPLPVLYNQEPLSPVDSVSKRCEIGKKQFIVLFYRKQVRPRMDNGEFILTPSISEGYAASFIPDENLESHSQKLAQIEVSGICEDSGYGWLEFNHPIHWTLPVTIKLVGGDIN